MLTGHELQIHHILLQHALSMKKVMNEFVAEFVPYFCGHYFQFFQIRLFGIFRATMPKIVFILPVHVCYDLCKVYPEEIGEDCVD